MQASSLLEVECLVDAETIVFLDVDDTLICYPSHLGNERWFIEQWALGDEARFHRLAAFLATSLKVVPVEEGAPEVIAQWQEAGARVIAITSRALEHPVIKDWQQLTYQQILDAGYRLDRSDLIFAGSTSKGEVIANFIAEMSIQPARILFFDDRLSDVEGVEGAFCRGEQLITVWYQACEPRRAVYDSCAAAHQLRLAIEAEFLAGRPVVNQGE